MCLLGVKIHKPPSDHIDGTISKCLWDGFYTVYFQTSEFYIFIKQWGCIWKEETSMIVGLAVTCHIYLSHLF